MKKLLVSLLTALSMLTAANLFAQAASSEKLFIDVHHLTPGSVKASDVAAAHAKDLAVQGKYGVHFLKYWVDEKAGTVYCLSSAADSAHITSAHKEAHGLLPQQVYPVTDGRASVQKEGMDYFLDIHQLGAGSVTADAVAKAHEKDLAVQDRYGVNFINYWVNEANGMVLCLSQAKKAKNVVKTHKKAHGLVPSSIEAVKQGQ